MGAAVPGEGVLMEYQTGALNFYPWVAIDHGKSTLADR